MNKQDLMKILHCYTPYELFCQKHHQELLHNLDILDLFLNTNPEYMYKKDGLHYPIYELFHDNFDPLTDFDTIENFSHTQRDPVVPAYGSNTDVLSGEKIILTQHDRFSPPVMHKHDYYELIYVYEGEFQHTIETETSSLHTGDICLIPPGIIHNLDVRNYSVILNILIEKRTFHNIFLNELKGNNILSDFFLGNIYTPNVNSFIIFHTFGDPQIQSVIIEMCLETLNKKQYFNELLHTHLLLLFGYLLRNHESNCELPIIKKHTDITNYGILKCIEDNYQSITLSELSKRFHYSPQQISNKLQALTGHSFSFLVLEKRMEKAKELLLYTNMKIKDIYLELGYQNQENFIRTFKKYYHVTPSEFRKTRK